MVFHWTPLSFLADLNITLVWMVSTRPLIFKSCSAFINPFVIVLSVPITIGIAVTFMLNSFFSSLTWSRYLFLFSLSFSFTMWSARTVKSTIRQVQSFFVDYHQVWSRLGDPFVSENPTEFCVSRSPGRIPGCAFTVCSRVQTNFLQSFQWISFSTLSYLLL